MDKARVAETLLAVMAGRRRASEIAGDLVEEHPQATLRFWRSLLGVVLSLTWRWVAGAGVAVVSGSILFKAYVDHVLFPTGFPAHVAAWRTWCVLAALCLWSTVVLHVFRYGMRDRLNAVGLGVASVLGALACDPWATQTRLVVPSVLVGVLSLCLGVPSLRRATLRLAVSASVLVAVTLGLGSLTTLWVLHGRPSVRALDAATFAIFLLSLAAQAWTLARTRRWLAPNRKLA